MIKDNSVKKVARAINKVAKEIITPKNIALATAAFAGVASGYAQQNIPPAEQKDLLTQFEFYQGNNATTANLYKTSRTPSGYEVRVNSKRYDSLFSMDLNGDKKFGDFEKTVLENLKVTLNGDIDELPEAERKIFYDAIKNKNSGEIEDSRNKSKLESKTSVNLSLGPQAQFNEAGIDKFGGSLDLGIDTFYKNQALWGLGLYGGVTFGKDGQILVQETGSLADDIRTTAILDDSVTFRAGLNFKAGYSGWYGLLGGGIGIDEKSITSQVDTVNGEGEVIKPGTPTTEDYTLANNTANIFPTARAEIGKMWEGVGFAIGTDIDFRSNNVSLSPYAFAKFKLGGGK